MVFIVFNTEAFSACFVFLQQLPEHISDKWAREVRNRDIFLQYLFKQKSCLREAWRIKPHIEIFLSMLFWNVFETENMYLKSSMHVAHLDSEIQMCY